MFSFLSQRQINAGFLIALMIGLLAIAALSCTLLDSLARWQFQRVRTRRAFTQDAAELAAVAFQVRHLIQMRRRQHPCWRTYRLCRIRFIRSYRDRWLEGQW